MAGQTFTLADAQAVVTSAIKGTGVAQTSVGTAVIQSAINKAVAATLVAVGLPEYAGDLYDTANLTFTSDVGPMPVDTLLPIAWGVTGALCTRKALSEVIRGQLTPLPGTTEHAYAFAGNNVIIRPVLANGDVNTFHYLKIPDLLTQASDVIQVSPALFQAICLQAALVCMGQWEGADQNEIARLSQWYQSLVDGFSGKRDQDLLKAWAEQTGRSKYGPQFNNAGV